VSDTPQLFDPDAFAPPPDPVGVHDLDPADPVDEATDDADRPDGTDAEPATGPDEDAAPLLEEPVELRDEDDDEDDAVLAAAIEADLARPVAAETPDVEVVDEVEVEVEPVSQSVLDTVLGRDTVVEKIALGSPPVLRSVAGGRHEARERALHLLYEVQIKGRSADEVLSEQVLAPDEYAADLVRGVAAHREELDTIIDRLARGWTVARMPTMDVVVLRLALFELAHRPDVPRGVILAEAVDLAGQYGTDDSSKFVNGLLAAAANELRAD
jgi:transcription antitermination protein NusB